MKDHVCQICNDSVKILKSHLKKYHDMTLQAYWVTRILSKPLGWNPKCKLGSCSNNVFFEDNHRRFREFCSVHCKAVYFMKNPEYKNTVGNTFRKLWKEDSFRDKKSKEISIRLKERYSNDPEFKERMVKQLYISGQNPEVLETKRQRLIARNKSLEGRLTSSLNMKRNHENPEIRKRLGLGYKTKKGYYFSTKLNKSLFYRSSYELKAMEILDNDLNVRIYQYESLSIPYKNNGKQSKFYPDFLVEYVNGNKEVIEIKPRFVLEHPLNLLKFAAARNYCEQNNYNFSIWTQTQLGL